MAQIFGHGGFFKTPVVGQRFMAAAMGTPVTVMETAGEGGTVTATLPAPGGETFAGDVVLLRLQ